jgi:hypothetical protein
MIKVFSYGGGVQSTAALVLAATGRIDYKTFLFCNVGEDSENPETLTYVEQIAKPYAALHDIELIELQRERGTLYQLLMSHEKNTVIPVRLNNGAPGMRACTGDFKIKVVCRWLRTHGASTKNPATVGMGISLDEFQRMRTDSGIAYERLEYPLIDLRLTRQDCIQIIQKVGLPVPPKSSCWFCPYHKLSQWQEMRQSEPELFWKAARLEEWLNEKRARIGKDKVWLTRKLIPLARATTEFVQGDMFDDDDACESGYCMV